MLVIGQDFQAISTMFFGVHFFGNKLKTKRHRHTNNRIITSVFKNSLFINRKAVLNVEGGYK